MEWGYREVVVADRSALLPDPRDAHPFPGMRRLAIALRREGMGLVVYDADPAAFSRQERGIFSPDGVYGVVGGLGSQRSYAAGRAAMTENGHVPLALVTAFPERAQAAANVWGRAGLRTEGAPGRVMRAGLGTVYEFNAKSIDTAPEELAALLGFLRCPLAASSL